MEAIFLFSLFANAIGIFLFWFFAAIAIGIVASSRNRSGFGWFALSLLISPIITGFLILALPTQSAQQIAAERARREDKGYQRDILRQDALRGALILGPLITMALMYGPR